MGTAEFAAAWGLVGTGDGAATAGGVVWGELGDVAATLAPDGHQQGDKVVLLQGGGERGVVIIGSKTATELFRRG